MSLGTDIQSTLPILREAAESMMITSCVIARGTPGDVLNEDTGGYDPTSVTIYTGRCRLKFGGSQANDVDAAGQVLTQQIATLSIPVTAAGSADVETDDVATITANPNDPAMVGKQFRVTGLHLQTLATARRLSVEIIS